VKAKNDEIRKVAAVDLMTSLPIGIDVSSDELMHNLKVDKLYYVSLKVYTAQDITGVAPEFVEFFTVLDVDQSIEDFIKTYWLYPKLIKFELSEVELA